MNGAKIMTYLEVPVRDIADGPGLRGPPDQSQLDDLLRSIRRGGLIEPLRVYPAADGGGYVCGLGGRRLTAARLAGLATVPCVVTAEAPAERERIIEQLATDLFHVRLAPVERARAFRRLLDVSGWSQRQLAGQLGLSTGSVSESLGLLDLAPEALALVETGQLPASSAIRLADLPADEQADEAVAAAAGRVPRRKIEERRKPAPELARFELTTPARWKVLVTATRKRATQQMLLAELAGLVERLREPLPAPEAA